MLKTRRGARLGPSWVALGRYLAGFWALLGGSWPLLGVAWASIGRFLNALGCLLAGLKHLLAAFWLPGTPWDSILEGLWACQAGFGAPLGTCFGMPSAAPRTLSHNAFIHAVTALLHLLALFLLPFWCGGLCAAHPPPPEGMPSVPDTRYKCLT